MDLLKSRIKKYLYLSLFASVCLPAGIPCIVLGAVNAVYPVMIIGIGRYCVRFLRLPAALDEICIAYRA